MSIILSHFDVFIIGVQARSRVSERQVRRLFLLGALGGRTIFVKKGIFDVSYWHKDVTQTITMNYQKSFLNWVKDCTAQVEMNIK